jgi:hypothetical protein
MTRFGAGMLCVMVEAPVSKRALEMAAQIALAELPAIVDALTADDGGAGFDDEATSQYLPRGEALGEGLHAVPRPSPPSSAEGSKSL